ncbi:uncharacterized protein LOC114721386 [Neltuma alba]|uniref:uncharacterized protein LOC114721386 n=1 Tax=Neltuma alba TaxID=207710 RepID=UPI0010A418B3|nr:uncharacterized protein LOC114721386 [Prosopis alba]
MRGCVLSKPLWLYSSSIKLRHSLSCQSIHSSVRKKPKHLLHTPYNSTFLVQSTSIIIFMAHQKPQHHLRDDDDSQDPQKFKESIFQPSSDNNKMIEFHRKDSASQKRKLIEEPGKFSVIASAPSSPFQLLRQPPAPFACRPGGSDQNLSRLAKDLNEMLRVSDPHVTKEPAKASLGRVDLNMTNLPEFVYIMHDFSSIICSKG